MLRLKVRAFRVDDILSQKNVNNYATLSYNKFFYFNYLAYIYSINKTKVMNLYARRREMSQYITKKLKDLTLEVTKATTDCEYTRLVLDNKSTDIVIKTLGFGVYFYDCPDNGNKDLESMCTDDKVICFKFYKELDCKNNN